MEQSENDVVSVDSADKIILRWDSTASFEQPRDHMIFRSDRQEIDLYLRAVDHLLQRSTSSSNDDQFYSSGTLQVAMTRLHDEFGNLLEFHTSPIDTQLLLAGSETTRVDVDEADDEDGDTSAASSLNHLQSGTSSCRSTNSIREIDLIPTDTIHDLRSIAKRMISCGYLGECVRVYCRARKSAVDASIKRLGVEDLSREEIQGMEWEILEMKIRQWLRASKVCVRIVFASEKKLCEEIFDGLCSYVDYDACFVEIIKWYALQLFNFAESISVSRRSPEKLFKLLDIHDCLSELLPDIEIVFESESLESVRVKGGEILSKLREAVNGIFTEFENKVVNEPSKVPVPGGTIHPLTRYVMNYISLISDYKETLIDLIDSRPVTGSMFGDHGDNGGVRKPDMDLARVEGKSALEFHLVWIIVVLQNNLEGKSKYYKDAPLAHLFMMNNVHYIVEKAKGLPELREMIGDGYLRKLTGKYRMAATNYQRSTWMRVLHCLRDEGLYVNGSMSYGLSKTALRERFKTFNAMFDEIHRTQAMWLVPDAQLREELRISSSDLLIPAYRSFFGRFKHHIESGKHPEYYIKYSVEDLEAAILDFLEGYPVSHHLRRRSSH